MSMTALLDIAEIQKELGLDDAQKKQTATLVAALQHQTQTAFREINFQELQNLTEEEREKRMTDVRSKVEEISNQADSKVSDVLKPQQINRLKQLQLQREGVAAFRRPDISKQLDLTSEQQEKLRALDGAGFGFGGPGGGQAAQRQQADALVILTADQKTKWGEVTGKAFQFPEPQGFGPGGFGRGPGGPGGPPGAGRLAERLRAYGVGQLRD